MPTVCIDQTEYDALITSVLDLQAKYACLSEWEALEHRIITERIPLIACQPCTPVSIVDQIIRIQNTTASLANDITTEQQHIAILDAKADGCLVSELDPLPAPIVCP